MEILINQYIKDPRNAVNNFWLANAYFNDGQYAAAASHFLRCAEWGDPMKDTEMIYESLLHVSLVLKKLGDRNFTEEGYLLHAINLCPMRPEAYWLLSQLYERQKKWHESYTMASLGTLTGHHGSMLDIGYVHDYMMFFQKAVAAWWIGRMQEARDIFFSLPEKDLNDDYTGYVQNNMSTIGASADPFLYYDKSMAGRLRFKFEGHETIEETYGQVYQDLFVLSMLNGKRNGYYLEIGSADPLVGSNTFLLERKFGWKGISIEYNEKFIKEFRRQRTNEVICKDATNINYDKLLRQSIAPMDIDYLQVDCEPPKTTYEVLLAMPFERYRFAVITFEHDYYADASRRYRDLSRKFLKSQGYVLAVSNVGRDRKHPFEDWWVHPDLVDPGILKLMREDDDSVHFPGDYFFSQPINQPDHDDSIDNS